MVIEDMEYLQVYVGATTMSMNDRFTLLSEKSPFQIAAPRRARRMSTNDGPLLSSDLRATHGNQNLVNEVVQQLGLDWRVQELQMHSNNSRAGSRPRSRASSIGRHSESSYGNGLVRSNSWGNLSRASSVGNLSQKSGRSGRSSGHYAGSRVVGFNRNTGLDLNRRLQMRDAWMRGRRARGRGRGQGGFNQRGRVQRNWHQNRRGRGQWGQQWGRQQWGRQQWGRQQWGRQRRWGYAQSERSALTPRGRAGLEAGGARARGAGVRGRGRGRGRGGQQRGVSHASMPVLKTLEQLDQELEEYMAAAPASLDKELEEYMAQNGLTMDTD